MVDDVEQKRLKRIEAARRALAERYAADPVGVARFEARMANLDRVRKRERERYRRNVLGEGDPMPQPPEKVRPAGMSNSAWKAERRRIDREYQDALEAWKADRRKRAKLNAPPPEQMGHAIYVEGDVKVAVGNEVKAGRAFCRRARFETFDWLTVPQVMALRRYRRAFDASELSATKCGLDVGPGGGAGGSDAAIARLEVLAFADIAVQRIESVVPSHLLATLRAVALHDHDFKAVALARFGSASGQRRTRVKRDFAAGVDALVALEERREAERARAAESVTVLAGEEQTANMDPAFLDERGIMRELADIAEIIRERVVGKTEQAE